MPNNILAAVSAPATALHELAQQFDHQGYVLTRFSHGGVDLIATRAGEVRHLDGFADAKRFIQNIGEADHG